MATIPYTPPTYPVGEESHLAIYSNDQIAQAKRLLADAKEVTVTRLVPGELARISEETGVSIKTLSCLRNDTRWRHIAPAPAETEDA